MPKTATMLLEEIKDAELDLRSRQDTFLRASGWTHTCQTPGCYCMWQKKLDDGRVILVDVARAVTLEKHLMPEDCAVDGGSEHGT